MANCEISLNLTKLDLQIINRWLKRHPQTYGEFIRENYPDNADEIIQVAEWVISQKRTEITPSDLDMSFDTGATQVVEKANNRSFVSDRPEVNYNGDSGAYNNMIKRFRDSIIKASIFNLDTNQIVNPNAKDLEFKTALNRNMFNYKQSLIKTLADYLGLQIDQTNTAPAAIFENIQTVLAAFNSRNNNHVNDTKYRDALDAYTILANFDNFVQQFSPFVKVKPGYEEYEAKDRYEYVGPTTRLDIISYKDDDAKANSIETNTSDLAKALLDYFPEYNEHGKIEGTQISQAGFNQVMTSFKRWINSAPYQTLVDFQGTEEEIRDEAIRTLNLFYEGDPSVMNRLFDKFVKLATGSADFDIERDTFSKNKLLGVSQIFKSGLDPYIKRIFWNLGLKTEANIAKSTTRYNRTISNKRLQDNYKNSQWNYIQDGIRTAVGRFTRNRFDEGSTLFDELCKKYRIKPDENDSNIIHIFNGTDHEVVLTLSGNKNHFTTSITKGNDRIDTAQKVPNDIAKTFIEDVLYMPVPEDYDRVLSQLSDNTTVPSLMGLYASAIGVVLMASNPDTDSDFIDKNGNLSFYRFNTAFQSLQTFLGIAFGTNISSTMRNQFGNNVAAYQLTSQIRQISKLALKMAKIKEGNSYVGNPVYDAILNGRTSVKEAVTRIDVNINGKKKTARDLTESEVAYVGIMVDFFNSYFGKGNDIEFQNTAFSDKNTHFSIPYSKYLKLDDKTELVTAIQNLMQASSPSEIEKARNVFESAIYNSRNKAYTTILQNLWSDYYKAFKPEIDQYLESKQIVNPNLNNKLDTIKWIISKYGSDIIESKFKENNIDVVPELHYSGSGFNETLDNLIDTYVFHDKDYSKNRLNKQKRWFLNDLISTGISINEGIDSVAVSTLIQEIGDSSWKDDLTHEVLLYKGDLNGDFQINPMLDAYFYSDVLLSNSYNDILFGRTFFHPNKYKPNKIKQVNLKTGQETFVSEKDIDLTNKDLAYYHDTRVIDDDYQYDPKTNKILFNDKKPVKSENYLIHSEASRLSASYKRTVNAGATTHTFLPMKYGIAPNINFAVVKDMPAVVFNMLGIKDKVDSMDGSGFSSPIQAILENWSLVDAPVGMDKKTIFGDTDARYGMPTLLKWAVYALTNDRRQMSTGSTISGDDLFKKMHSIDLGKIVDVSKYYKSSREDGYEILTDDWFERGRVLTHMDNVYRYDSDEGKYYLISDLHQNGRTLTWNEFETDNKGRVLSETAIPRKRDINTLYDIDQVFGGAWCMEYDAKTKQLEYNNANNRILADIVCNEELKNKMTSYIVNKSAIKVGARNINESSILTTANQTPLWTTTMSIQFGGVQMNADHELNESDVTEMSQMISALIQNGYFGDEVNAIYEEIGKIVSTSLGRDLENIGDYAMMHRNLGKELIKMFSSGSKDTIGLAQSYLLKAAKEFEAGNVDVKIPFSDPTLNGAFIANLVSNINKSGIRRRYAGIAAVLVPSRGMIQYYNVPTIRKNENNEEVHAVEQMTYADLVNYVREAGLLKKDADGNIIRNAQYYINHKGTFENGNYIENPFIHEINRREADMGDTIIVVDKTTNEEVGTYILDNPDDFDLVRNLYTDSKYGFYNWTIRPRDLRQADTTFEVDGVRYSIYDLDSVRGAHYLRQWLGKNDFIDIGKVLSSDPMALVKLGVIENALKTKLPRTGLLSAEAINKYKSLLNRQTKQDLKDLETETTLGYNTAFGNNYKDYRSWLYKDTPFGEDIITQAKLEYPEASDTQAVLMKLINENISLETALSKYKLPKAAILALDYRDNRDLDQTLIEATQLGLSPTELGLALKTVDPTLDIPKIIAQWSEFQWDRKPVQISNVNTRFAEIVMGRLNAEQLGLRKNDSINEIKRNGANFFVERLREDFKMPNSKLVDSSDYDAVLTGKSGEKLLVAIRSLHKDPNYLKDYGAADNKFETRNNRVFYNNVELCSQIGKQFYSKPTAEGPVNLVVLDDLNEIDEILDSSLYSNVRFNYRQNNQYPLMQYQFKDNIDGDKVIKPITLYNGSEKLLTIDQGTDLREYLKQRSYFNEDITKELRSNDKSDVDWKIQNEANQKFAAFQKQLQYVGARIPTQSMQSFMGLQLVGFSNSDVNEVYVPAVQTWLQGSDYDIDKLFIMGYEIGKNGRLQTFSRLQNKTTDLDTIMSLGIPSGETFTIDDASTHHLSNLDVKDILANQNYSKLVPILSSSDHTVSFASTVSGYDKSRILNLLNLHSETNLRPDAKESALKNSVVNRILNLLKHPRNQVPAYNPISMAAFQELAANSTLGGKEKRMTSDNPLVKFIMQVQNMVGKDVIGITAVGMKVFFATTTFVTQRVNDLADAIKRNDQQAAAEALGDICFDDTLTGEGLATIANINFEPVFEVLQDNKEFRLDLTSANNLPSELSGQSSVRLLDVINELQQKSDIIDGAEAISELLSCATDNAKELILAKINATVDFADTWTHLLATGHKLTDIADLMMSPIFEIVTRYSKTDVFSDLISGSNPKKAVSFVLGNSQLPGADLLSLKIIMGSYDSDGFIQKLIYQTYTEDGNGHKRGELVKDANGNYIERHKPLISPEELQEANTKGSDFRKNIFSLFSNIDDIEKSTTIANLLADHVYYLISTSQDKSNVYDDYEEESQQDEEYDFYATQWEDSDYEGDITDEEDFAERKLNSEDFGEDYNKKISKKQLTNVYRYLTKYVIPKNIAILNLNNRSTQIAQLKQYVKSIQPAVEEQQITGAILGVNQGLKTNQYKFYSALKRTENFINERCMTEDDPEAFNVIKFLENKDYRQRWIDKYDAIKSTVNPLKLINTVPNFREMYKLNRLAYREMQHSVEATMNFKLADAILNDPKSRLNEEEFKVLEKYSRDLLIMNWIFMNNFKVKLPSVSPLNVNVDLGRNYPHWTKNDFGDSTFTQGRPDIELNSSEGLATYVSLFENWIVPYLKTKYNNAFTRNITFGNKLSSTHNIPIRHARMAMNMMTVDASIATQHQYSEILNAFNDIAQDMIPEIGLSVQDALFLYNTLVYKNAFAENGFTRLMETINVSGNNALINDWSTYLADLDYMMYDLGELSTDKELTINDDGSLNFGVLQGNIKDLLYRLAFTKSAYKFGVSLERDGDGAVSELVYTDMFGNIKTNEYNEPIPSIPVKNPDANDWTMEMPVFGQTAVEPGESGFKPNYKARYTYNSKEVVSAISQEIARRFGLSDQINYITVNDIKDAWVRKNNGEELGDNDLYIKDIKDYNRMLDSKAFIHKGKIWVLGDKLTNDTVLHEILHVVFAGMKFNTDDNIRTKYYDLLNEATDIIRRNPNLYRKLKAKYDIDYASDFKEELLVYLLTENFRTNLKQKFGGYQFTDNLNKFVVDLLNNILETDIPQDVNVAKLGNTTLRDIALMFNSRVMRYDENPLTTVNISLDQKVKTIKRILIQAGTNPDKKNFIKYNC